MATYLTWFQSPEITHDQSHEVSKPAWALDNAYFVLLTKVMMSSESSIELDQLQVDPERLSSDASASACYFDASLLVLDTILPRVVISNTRYNSLLCHP